MGSFVEQHWAPSDTFGLSKRDRAGGAFLAYVPDHLGSAGPAVGVEAFSKIADVQSNVTRADGIVGESGLFLNHLLLRSESIASSYIEGHVISPKKLAIADALQQGKPNALAVIRNLRATEYAIEVVSKKWDIELDDLAELQQTIAPQISPGFRTDQNWVGGTGHSPLTAEFVPPPHELVVPLLEDLLEYVNRSQHPPLLKAAIAHAQFETIHPFSDGNGRTGRALIHAILKRDGVTQNTLLPISTIFSTNKNSYIEGLTAFRGDTPSIDAWVQGFAAAADLAAENIVLLKQRSTELDRTLQARLQQWRLSQGLPQDPRAGSTVQALLRELASRPVLTVQSVREGLGVSASAAEQALNELSEAGVLSRNKNHRGAVSAFTSDGHLNLVALTERRVKAAGYDTAHQAPRFAPPLPASTDLSGGHTLRS